MKFTLLIFILIPNFAFAFKPLILHSGKVRINLLELKVSDGCDACEPEEKWVANLRNEKNLWKKFVPVIEKPDQNGTYPTFALNGAEWIWSDTSAPPQDSPKSSGEEAGELNVARQRLQEFDVAFNSKGKIDGATVTANFLDQDLMTLGSITKKLHKSGKTFSTRVFIPFPKGQMTQIRSVVFWITDDDGNILQALGSNIQIE